MTWLEYETGREGRITDLHSRVHRGAYRALLSRRVYIEKEDGRKRPLGVAALEDKIVQQAVAPSSIRFTRKTFSASRMAFVRGAASIKRWMRSRMRS